MKFIVDELPDYYDDCPFSEEEWHGPEWISICTLTLTRSACNLHKVEGKCYGLKELKGANNE